MPAYPVEKLRGPLLLRRLRKPHAEDYAVEIEAGENGRLSVGRILLSRRRGITNKWQWSITGPAAPGASVNLFNDAESLDVAKAAFRAGFEAVLFWATISKDGELPWHPGAVSRGDP